VHVFWHKTAAQPHCPGAAQKSEKIAAFTLKQQTNKTDHAKRKYD
jgi:hypothetical protein